jgi:hypothetical protein
VTILEHPGLEGLFVLFQQKRVRDCFHKEMSNVTQLKATRLQEKTKVKCQAIDPKLKWKSCCWREMEKAHKQ